MSNLRAKLIITVLIFIFLELIVLVALRLGDPFQPPASPQSSPDDGLVLNGQPDNTKSAGQDTEKSPTGVPLNDSKDEPGILSDFYKAALDRGRHVETLCPQHSAVDQAILAAYGAIYVARRDLFVPHSCFSTPEQVDNLRKQAPFQRASANGVIVTLQKPALDAFLAAGTEARSRGLSITPKGSRASARDYLDTREIWYRNLEVGIRSAHGINSVDLKNLRSPDIRISVAAVLAVEKRGILLGAGGGKSILQIAAPTGTSQHIAGLAIDIEEHESASIRAIMEKHGFFQTVANDFTHFTFLGCSRAELSASGLVHKSIAGRVFYVPKLS